VPPHHPTPVRPARAAVAAAAVALALLGPAAVAAPGPVAGAEPHAGIGAWVPPLDRSLDDLGVIAPFDPPEHDWLPGHRGVDLDAAAGEPVRSPAPGVVTFAGPVAGRDVLVVTHDDGLRTSLEPVTATVPRGTHVASGGVVGTVQVADGTVASHCAGACVHWGVRRGERYVDPLALLGDRPPIVLLPLA